MKNIQIQTPIWKTRSVGLNIQGLNPNEKVSIEIMYIEKKSGKRLYPDRYEILVEDILKYPSQTVNRNVKVHIVPISSLIKAEDKSQLSFF